MESSGSSAARLSHVWKPCGAGSQGKCGLGWIIVHSLVYS